MKKTSTLRLALFLMVCTMASQAQASYLGSADTAIYNVLWKVVNFISGIVGILVVRHVIVSGF